MTTVRIVSALVAGAALCLGPAATAAASDLPTPGTDISVTGGTQVGTTVNSPVSAQSQRDKPPKTPKPPKAPKPNHGKHQQPPPVPAPPPNPAPPPLPAPVPRPGQQLPNAVRALTASPLVANRTTPASTAAAAHPGGDRPSALAGSQRPTRPLASDGQAESRAAAVAAPLIEPALPAPFQLSDISLWAYGAVLSLFILLGLGAWVLHLRGARW